MTINKDTAPRTVDFIEAAANYRTSNAAWGDGTFLDAIIKIIEQLIPIFMNCWLSKAQFVENVKDLTWTQRLQLHRAALQQARRVPNLKIRDHRAAAEAAYNGVLSQLELMDDNELEACYDELTQ
ncbi:MAG: hypothetical protein WC346_16190 [Methanogenium sp.]|jgi:hypothetical protein